MPSLPLEQPVGPSTATPPAAVAAPRTAGHLWIPVVRWGRAGWRTAGLAAAGASLLAASGAVHLDLYATGYDGVPTIGTLFLLQAAAAIAVAIAVVATLHPLASVAGALLAISTLGGYLISLGVRLFGFHEVPTTAGAAAGTLEILAFASLGLGALAAVGAAPLRRLWPLVPAGSVAAALALAVELAVVAPASTSASSSSGATAPVVAVSVPGYGTVLATTTHQSLYLLSDERPGHLSCTGACLSLWPPLLVAGSATRFRARPGLGGSFGAIIRGTSHQLTYNGYPLYTYVGDSGPGGSAGEGIAANGGVWYLLRAGAGSRATTAVARHAG